MKVVIMMRDREFRDAFAEMVSENVRDIYAIVNGSTGTHKEAVILTDRMPHELEDEAIEKIEEVLRTQKVIA